jgi:hypothetical protein
MMILSSVLQFFNKQTKTTISAAQSPTWLQFTNLVNSVNVSPLFGYVTA